MNLLHVNELAVPACRGIRKDGKPCRSPVVGADGYCAVHGASPRSDPAELGRLGGLRSAEVRREQGKSVRQRLAEAAAEDVEHLRRVYREALEAELQDGLCDHRTRLAAADSYLNQAFGRPVQPVGAEEGRIVIILPKFLEEMQEAEAVEVEDAEVEELPAGS